MAAKQSPRRKHGLLEERREFLRHAVLSGAAILVGCSEDSLGPPGEPPATPAAPSCPGDLAGGELIGEADVNVETMLPFGTKLSEGLDARQFTDLSVIQRDEPTTPTELFFIRTEVPDQLGSTDNWEIAVSGLVQPTSIALTDLVADAVDQGVHVLECAGNGSNGGFGLLSAAQWRGVPVTEVLASLDIDPAATQLLVRGFDGHSMPSAGGFSIQGAEWVFSFEQLAETGAFFATEMNGAPLTPDHGFPVRIYVPGWYGCACIKWVNEIVLVDDMEPLTSQMEEFAGRLAQEGNPQLAADFSPASMDQAAMPIRIEKWLVDGQIAYKVVGILWGGATPAAGASLEISFDAGLTYEKVDVCPDTPVGQEGNQAWTIWEHVWLPEESSTYLAICRIDDPDIPTSRLDRGWYARAVYVDEV